MVHLRSFFSFQTRLVKLHANTHHDFIAHFHTTQLKQPKANQTLESYLNSNSTHKILAFFKNLLRNNLSSIDSYSILYVLKACTKKSTINGGKQVHVVVTKLGFEQIIFLQTSLINVYSSSGNLEYAQKVFDEITCKNAVSWTALISAYVNNQQPREALRIFRMMLMDNVEPDQVTITVTLSACSDLGSLEMGEWIHAYVRRKMETDTVDVCLNNALIHMYLKCGDIGSSRKLFDSMIEKDVTTWTSMIVGLALHGEANDALDLFESMKKINKSSEKKLITPNDVTFVGVLMACSHSGMVEEGKRVFKSMVDEYGLRPKCSHFGCMVDLLCRSGLLNDAYAFITEMPVKPNAVMWRTLLNACSVHGNVELGAEARRKLVELVPDYTGDDVVMSNIFASKGMWNEKIAARDQIKRRRTPGSSYIEQGRP